MTLQEYVSQKLHQASTGIQHLATEAHKTIGIGCQGQSCYECGTKLFGDSQVTQQVTQYIVDFVAHKRGLTTSDSACVRLFLVGCPDKPNLPQDQEILSTQQNSLTLGELLANTGFVVRMCLKYRATQVRIQIRIDDQRDIGTNLTLQSNSVFRQQEIELFDKKRQEDSLFQQQQIRRLEQQHQEDTKKKQDTETLTAIRTRWNLPRKPQ